MAKIPEHAKRVFEGIIFDVYHWDQKMFDGSIATFEGLKRVPTVIIIALDEDKNIYYSEQSQPHYEGFRLGIFGGRAEKGETPLDVAKRELLEESGLVSDKWEHFHTYNKPGKIDWDICYFIARDCKKVTEQNLDSGEKINIKKTTIKDFVDRIITNENFRETELKDFISDYSENKKEELINLLKS